FLRLMLGTLMNIIATRTSIPEQKTCFYVDEAAQLGYMPQLLEALTLLRSYGLQCATYWQDLSQIQFHYPNAWQAIINNSAVLQIFGLKNHLVARSLAEIVGIDARRLLDMADNEQLVVHNGKDLHFARRLDYLKDACFKGRWDPNPMFARAQPAKTNSAVAPKNDSVVVAA
ncbi:MAG TPA: TraM recognition domain-containing protein, partial [Candidatus Cybelea sp.]|nr:TraM recognition domain-containing protein [Candidatus Cybelea sp.]